MLALRTVYSFSVSHLSKGPRAFFILSMSTAIFVVSSYFSGEFFQEFTIKFGERKLDTVFKNLIDRRIIPGITLGKDFPSLKEVLLSCFTEVHNVEDVEKFAEVVREVMA